MPTPESKVKRRVSALLKHHHAYYFMPVQTGYGMASLDYLCCLKGEFFAVETKSEGKLPTPRQEGTIAAMERAGARVFVVIGTSDLSLAELTAYLNSKSK